MKKIIAKKAIEMTLLDAIEKGHIDSKGLIAYMKSATYKRAVDGYISTMETVFKEQGII